jgi:hypothetical protein
VQPFFDHGFGLLLHALTQTARLQGLAQRIRQLLYLGLRVCSRTQHEYGWRPFIRHVEDLRYFRFWRFHIRGASCFLGNLVGDTVPDAVYSEHPKHANLFQSINAILSAWNRDAFWLFIVLPLFPEDSIVFDVFLQFSQVSRQFAEFFRILPTIICHPFVWLFLFGLVHTSVSP